MVKRVWKKWLACVPALSMVVSLGACSGVNSGGQEAPPLTQEVGEPDKSVYMNPTQDVEARVEALLSQMTLEEKIGEITAKEVRAIGVQWTFAPCLGNPQNVRWGRSYECFSEDTDEVAEFGAAYIRGFQGELGSEEFLDENHIIACAKHYIGEGYTVDGINQGNVKMSEEEFVQAEVGSEAHREVAREAVRKSLVLLKNEDVGGQTALEALEAAANIRLCGQKAYDIGAQCGGWTITWQGLSGMITKGTSIIDGIAKAVMPEKKLSHDVKGEVAPENEAIIVVVGEGPYAETEGDRKANAVTISTDDKVMLGKLRDSLEASPKDIPVVAILIGGRSLDISEYEDMFDGIIMAWLPGTEGAGIADVLFGEYDFTGKLNFTWHEVAGDPTSQVLYEKGYGLTK